MNICFLILIVMHILNIGIALGRHGQERTVKYNWIATLIGSGIGITLLYFAVKTGF